MSMTPITPGQFNADPGPDDLGDLEAAFQRVFDTPGDPDVETFDVSGDGAEGIIPSSTSSTREEGDGGGDVSPAPTPNTTPDAPADESGPTTFTPPVDVPNDGGMVIVDDGPGGVAPIDTTPPVDPTPTPAPITPEPSSFDINKMFEAYLGRPVGEVEGRELIGLIDDLNNGRVVLTPPNAPQTTAPAPVQSAPPPAPVAPPTPQLDEWGLPVETPQPVVAELPPQVLAELEEMKNWRAQQEAAQRQQWEQWVGQEQAAAADEFAASAPIALAPEELVVLERKAAASGVFALELQRTNNPRAAWHAALEQTIYTDPGFRQKVIDAQVAAATVSDVEVQNRTRLAASVSAGGGTVPATPVSSAPLDMKSAKEAAARDVSALWDNGTPGG